MSRGVQGMNLVVAAAVLLVAIGCSSRNNANAGYGASTAAPATGASATASRTGSSATSADTSAASSAGGEVAASGDISTMSDSNIVAKLDAGDKGEVELARLMETKATSDSVRGYARTLVTDHTKSEQQVMSLERKLKLAEKPLTSDTTRQNAIHVLARFRGLPKGAAADSAFVQHEIEDHQHDIADARAMEAQAKDAQLKDLIHQTIPVLNKHLDLARQLGHRSSQTAPAK